MAYTNLKGFLIDATKLPVAIEAKLPAGAPVISTMLLDAADKIPAVPDFPMEIPDLPAVPELPEMPELPGFPEFPGAEAGLRRRRIVTEVEVREVAVAQERREIIPSPAVGVIPEVRTRRGI